MAALFQALQPTSIIPQGSQAPSPQQFQQGVQKSMPSSPLPQLRASTEPGGQTAGGAAVPQQNPLLAALAHIVNIG